MLTPISPISVSRRASSPGLSSTMTTRVVKRLSVPCLPGMRATPVLPPASASATRAAGAGRLRVVEGGDDRSRSSRYARSTSATGAAFAPRICTQSSGSLAAMRVVSRSALAGEADARRPARRRSGAASRLDDDLRHVRDERDAAVVLVGRHLDGRRAEVEDEVLDGARAPVA